MEKNSSIDDIIHKRSEFNSTLKKCQSLINLQRMIIINQYNIQNTKLLEKFYLKADMTNKQSNDVINSRIKNIFNLNNYEQNIKSEAWQKDLSKIFLGLNDENKGKVENAYFEYNYNNRNKKKEGLIFIRNFFRKMKSAKKNKNLFNKKNIKFTFEDRKNDINFLKFNSDNDKIMKSKEEKQKEEKEKKENEINNIWNKVKLKYNSSLKEINENEFNKKLLTEINNNSLRNIKEKKLFKSKYINLTTEKNKKIKKNLFPKITLSNSSKKLFSGNNKGTKGIYRNKTYNSKLQKIYNNDFNKKKYLTLNNEKTDDNFDMPELLKHRKIPLFKKNNKIFLSPLHYSKYEQMSEIKNKLIKFGFHDKDVFKIYNKNV